MSTELDLRNAIDELAAEASDVEQLTLLLERRTDRPAARSERLRLRPGYAVAGGLVVAVVVVATAVAAGVVRSRGRSEATPSAAVSALSGVTWTDRASGGTVVFTATTARVSDGCDAALYGLKVGPHTLDVGQPIGGRNACAGGSAPPYDRQHAAVAKFDLILSGRSTWNRTGATLTITRAGAGSIALRPSGPAVTVTGEHWTLNQAVEHQHTINGPLTAATLSIDQAGTFTANDLCNGITGAATITTTTIKFALSMTQIMCGVNPIATSTIDAVLSGPINYSIVNDRLFLYGRDDNILVYGLSS